MCHNAVYDDTSDIRYDVVPFKIETTRFEKTDLRDSVHFHCNILEN